jgi:hypothetical protein
MLIITFISFIIGYLVGKSYWIDKKEPTFDDYTLWTDEAIKRARQAYSDKLDLEYKIADEKCKRLDRELNL